MHSQSPCQHHVTWRQLIWAVLLGYLISTLVAIGVSLYLALTVVRQQVMVQQVNVGTDAGSVAKDIGLQYRLLKDKTHVMPSLPDRRTSP